MARGGVAGERRGTVVVGRARLAKGRRVHGSQSRGEERHDGEEEERKNKLFFH